MLHQATRTPSTNRPSLASLRPHIAVPGNWNLESVVAELRSVRERWRLAQHRQQEYGGRELPSREALHTVVSGLCGAARFLAEMRRHGGADVFLDRLCNQSKTTSILQRAHPAEG